MRIAVLVEGRTERVFMLYVRAFLETRLAGQMPRLDPLPYDGRIPKCVKLRRVVDNLLGDPAHPADAVIALTDVYTGSHPPEFADASDVKSKMREWVGENDRFYPHAAQHDFEAWLLPYWEKILRLAGSNRAPFGPNPEQVDHLSPPAHRLQEVFRTGNRRRSYVKTRDAKRILLGEDLLIAANACPELKAFLNTIVTLCDGEQIP
ncbi:MAG: DUF4276 family protein [Thermoguttaceae bacterium]|jgi:hypothetical protein|nr:DUF4276 family protein [Thermoguttaceae bacterium]